MAKATKPDAINQAGDSCIRVPADAFNDGTLQLNRAMGIADLIYSLSLVDGGIESVGEVRFSSATDAMLYLMNDAYEKLSRTGTAGGAK